MIYYGKQIKGLCFVEDVIDENGEKKFSILFDNNCNMIPLGNKYLKYYRRNQTNSFSTINRIARDLCYLYDFLCISKIDILCVNVETLREFVKYLKVIQVRPQNENDKDFIRNKYCIERTLLQKLNIVKPNKQKESKVTYLCEMSGLDSKSIYRIFDRVILYFTYLHKYCNCNNTEVIEYFQDKDSTRVFLKAQCIEIRKHEIHTVDDDMIFAENEISEINKIVSAPYERLLYFILEKTGIRIGEALGLKIFSYDRENIRNLKGDLTFEMNRWKITIYWRPENPFFCRTKSHRTRSITLKENETATFELLLERYLRFRYKKVKSKKNDWLLISNRGNQLTQNVAYSQFKRTLSKCFLSHRKEVLTLHSYRHTFATRELQKGVPIEAVSKILGHKKVKTTQDIYVHYTIDDILKIREKIDEELEVNFDGKY